MILCGSEKQYMEPHRHIVRIEDNIQPELTQKYLDELTCEIIGLCH